MANNAADGGNNDPREAFEQLREQMFQALNKGFNEAVSALQEVGAVIEERLEEVFGTTSGSKRSSGSTSPAETTEIVEATAKLSLIHI